MQLFSIKMPSLLPQNLQKQKRNQKHQKTSPWKTSQLHLRMTLDCMNSPGSFLIKEEVQKVVTTLLGSNNPTVRHSSFLYSYWRFIYSLFFQGNGYFVMMKKSEQVQLKKLRSFLDMEAVRIF